MLGQEEPPLPTNRHSELTSARTVDDAIVAACIDKTAILLLLSMVVSIETSRSAAFPAATAANRCVTSTVCVTTQRQGFPRRPSRWQVPVASAEINFITIFWLLLLLVIEGGVCTGVGRRSSGGLSPAARQ